MAGLGAAYLLSRAHDVELFEQDTRAGGHVAHGRAPGHRPRHGLHRPQRAQLPVPRAALPRAGRGRAGVGDVVLGRLRRLRARVVGPPAVRAGAERRQPALPPLPARGHALAPDGQGHARTRPRGCPSDSTSRDTATPSGSARTSWSRSPPRCGRPRPERALDFPAAYAIRFFENHGMLGLGRFRWRTVDRRQPPLRRGAARAASGPCAHRARRPRAPARPPTASS